MKQKLSFYNNLLLLVLLFIILIILLYNFNLKDNFTDNNVIDSFIYYDEKNNKINHKHDEYIEQLQAQKYIEPNSVVLELGARYGTVSCTINSKLNDKKNQVSVEPDSLVWDALENNMKRNNVNFNIIKGFISLTPLELEGDGYSLSYKEVENSKINNFTLEEIEKKYNLKFDTLVADCEGCIEKFFDENPTLYSQLKLIIMEEDNTGKCNYDKIKNNLNLNGFKRIEMDTNDIIRSVWKK